VSLGQDVLAKLIHWFLGIILAYSVFIFGRRFFNVRVGILAAGLIYITPLVSWLSSTAYIDLTTAFFSFLSFYTLLIWFWKKNLRWLIMAAILAAAAIGTKWLALVILFPQLFLLIWGWRHQRKRFWSAIKELLIFAGIIILATLPWTLFAYYYTHNPIYPVFGLKMLPEEWTDWGRYDLFKISPPANYFQYFSQKIWRLWPLLAEQFIFRLQPVMLIFIIGIFTWRKLDYKIKLMIVVGAVYFLAWSLIPIHEPRYFLPVMVWLIVPAAAIWLNFFSRRKSLLIFSFIFVILIMLRNINSSWNQNQKYLTYIIGRHTPQDFLQKEGLRKWYVPDYFYFQGKEK